MRTFRILIIIFFSSFFTHSVLAANRDSIVTYSKKFLGVKYKYAQSNPKKGFDCSGFVYYVFTHFNVPVPRNSREFLKHGKVVSPDLCEPGDIIVFTGTKIKDRNPAHVGIVVSGTGENITFIHSSSGKKNAVVISSFKKSPSYKKRMINIVRY